MDYGIRELLKYAVAQGASDIHLAVGDFPVLRIMGSLKRIEEKRINPKDAQDLLMPLMNQRMVREFEENMELDFSLALDEETRFRVNIFKANGGMGGAFRVIPHKIPSLGSINLQKVGSRVAKLNHGMVLVTGPTGSGKSTTLAAIIDEINSTRPCRIFTIEDPVEYIHSNKKAMISQRELNTDTLSFTQALRHLLRQDPDVVLLGEMRDRESISLAITIAETGHLVFSTLHTVGACETIDRIVDVFPSDQQNQIRVQLATVLRVIISQQLIPRRDGKDRVAAREALFVTDAVKNMVRESKTFQIQNAIDTGRQIGMRSMEEDVADLYKMGLIDFESAKSRVSRPELFMKLTGQV